MSRKSQKAYREKHDIEIFEGCGTTETSPVISVNLGRQSPRQHRCSHPGTVVKIEAIEMGDACEVGEIGKILVKGDGAASGYLNDMEESICASSQAGMTPVI